MSVIVIIEFPKYPDTYSLTDGFQLCYVGHANLLGVRDMGIALLHQLFPAHLDLLIDDAREVGVMPVRCELTAMRVGRDDGELIYLRETPIFVATIWRSLDARNGRYRWWRLEVKVEGKNNDIRPNDEIVIAEHPYSSGWLEHVPFKSSSKKGALDRSNFTNNTFQSIVEAVYAVEQLKYDYWEKGNYLTAGISQPDLPFDPEEPARNVQRNALYVFGSCNEFAEIEERLLRSENARRLIDATEQGTLRFWAPGAKLTIKPQLLDEVKEEGWSLMCLSVRQALAGPHCDNKEWLGRPVVEKIDQIYRGHINRRNRQLADERSRLVEFDEAMDRGEPSEVVDEYRPEALAPEGHAARPFVRSSDPTYGTMAVSLFLEGSGLV